MGWMYSQSTGQIYHNGVVIGRGYSGIGAGKNNPNMQHVAFQGPIPKGMYHIGPARHSVNTGPVTINLTSIGHNAFGRTDFAIHGDNKRMNFTASKGCIILRRPIRTKIANSTDKILKVVH